MLGMKTSSIEIAVYGGAFNPPHIGHISAIEQAAGRAQNVLVVPSFCHPFGKMMAPFDVRCDWMGRIVTEMRGRGVKVEISMLEQAMHNRCPGPIFSWFLLREIALQNSLPTKSIALVVGEDVMEHFPNFRYADQIMQDFSLLTVREQVRVHSTDIRQSLSSGMLVDTSKLSELININELATYYAKEHEVLSHG